MKREDGVLLYVGEYGGETRAHFRPDGTLQFYAWVANNGGWDERDFGNWLEPAALEALRTLLNARAGTPSGTGQASGTTGGRTR